jgi:hypothetical protein
MKLSVAESLPADSKLLKVDFGMESVDSAFQERLQEMWGPEDDHG